MCRSKGSRVCGKELGAARELRNLIVVALAGSSAGRSPSVFTVQRSTPHATFPVAADVGAGLDAQAASSVATATIASAAPTRKQAPMHSSVRLSRLSASLRGGDHRREESRASRDGPRCASRQRPARADRDRKSTRLNSSHVRISYAVFCLKKKKTTANHFSSQTKKEPADLE